jgi:hypothetical protein
LFFARRADGRARARRDGWAVAFFARVRPLPHPAPPSGGGGLRTLSIGELFGTRQGGFSPRFDFSGVVLFSFCAQKNTEKSEKRVELFKNCSRRADWTFRRMRKGGLEPGK